MPNSRSVRHYDDDSDIRTVDHVQIKFCIFNIGDDVLIGKLKFRFNICKNYNVQVHVI